MNKRQNKKIQLNYASFSVSLLEHIYYRCGLSARLVALNLELKINASAKLQCNPPSQ